MAAPTGVHEELPQEPVKAGPAAAELAEPPPAEAETAEAARAQTEETEEKAAPAGVVPAGAVPAQAEPAPEERGAPGLAGTAEAGAARPAEAEAAGTAEAEPAGAAGMAEAEPAGAAGMAEAEPAGAAGMAEAEPVGAGEPAETGWEAEEGSRDVSPLAVAGIILGVIALVGVAVGVLAVVTHGFRPKTVVTYRPAAVFGLRPGQCVNSGSDALKVTVLSCARPHDAEVFGRFTLPAGAWPGASAVQADASNGCVSRFDSYIDPQLATASLTQEYVYPNQAAWQAGQRIVVCEVRAVTGRLTGSVRAGG
jgi:hypothetical protein